LYTGDNRPTRKYPDAYVVKSSMRSKHGRDLLSGADILSE
jgi:hypothetical protein